MPTIKIGVVPGQVRDLEVPEGTTVARALELAFPVTEREVGDHHHHGHTRVVREGGVPAGVVTLNGVEVSDTSTIVNEGDSVLVVRKIAGN